MSAKRLTGTELELTTACSFVASLGMATFPLGNVALHYVIAGSRNMSLVLCG